MNFSVKKSSALIYSIISYFIIVSAEYYLTVTKLAGKFTYCLDDAYTHMAIAKNAALHSVWGITQYNFSSSTSAPLWTFILAILFKIFGLYTIIPLILNCVIGIFIIISAYKILARYIENGTTLLVLLLTLIVIVPIPLLAFTGMEPLLHILLVSLFIQSLIPTLSGENKRSFYLLLLTSALACIARYEAYFMVIAAACIFLFEKKYAKAFCLLLSGWSLITIYGLWSLAHGWHFFPNTLLIKGNLPTLSISGIIYFFQVILEKIYKFSHIYSLLFIMILLVIRNLYSKDKVTHFVSMFNYIILITFAIHITAAYVAEYFRYEAYLVFLGILGIALNFSQLENQLKSLFTASSKLKNSFTIILLLATTLPFVYRGVGGLMSITPASKNIHDQQRQMASFVNKYYPTGVVAINDIGAMSFYTEAHVIDMVGLADLDILRLIKTNKYNYIQVDSLARRKNFNIAIIYDKWFDNPRFGGVPRSWVNCGSWMVSFVRVLGDAKVTFYASDSTTAKGLVNNLNDFNRNYLPKDVTHIVN